MLSLRRDPTAAAGAVPKHRVERAGTPGTGLTLANALAPGERTHNTSVTVLASVMLVMLLVMVTPQRWYVISTNMLF